HGAPARHADGVHRRRRPACARGRRVDRLGARSRAGAGHARMTAEPFALYVHVPWCRHVCPYCDFNVYAAAEAPEPVYVEAVAAELGAWAGRAPCRGRRAKSVYLGGGTPSLLSPAAIATVLEAVGRGFGIASGAEVTLEANPGTVTRERLAGERPAPPRRRGRRGGDGRGGARPARGRRLRALRGLELRPPRLRLAPQHELLGRLRLPRPRRRRALLQRRARPRAALGERASP